MSIFDTAREKIREHLEKSRQDREKMEELHKEVDRERQKIFEEQFKKNSLEVAKKKAYKDAAQKSGIQKLRAETRVRRLNEQSSAPEPGTWREKMRDYTAKNIARREENLKRTEEIRSEAEKIKLQRLNKTPQNRSSGAFGNSTLASRKPNWKM